MKCSLMMRINDVVGCRCLCDVVRAFQWARSPHLPPCTCDLHTNILARRLPKTETPGPAPSPILLPFRQRCLRINIDPPLKHQTGMTSTGPSIAGKQHGAGCRICLWSISIFIFSLPLPRHEWQRKADLPPWRMARSF